MLIADWTEQREPLVRSALLTAGSGGGGPIVNSAYKALTRYSQLCGVVVSEKKSPTPTRKKLAEYGTWYALQYLTSRTFDFISGNTNVSRLLPPEMGVRTWRSKQDRHDISKWLKSLEIDVVVVCDFHHILTRDFLAQFGYCINIHPSLLPSYRGPHPIIWGLLDRSPTFGITLHLIDDGIDTGDIVCQTGIRRPLLPLSFIVEMRLARVLPELIKCTVEQIRADDLHTRQQEGGFYLPLPTLANRDARKQRNRRESS